MPSNSAKNSDTKSVPEMIVNAITSGDNAFMKLIEIHQQVIADRERAIAALEAKKEEISKIEGIAQGKAKTHLDAHKVEAAQIIAGAKAMDAQSRETTRALEEEWAAVNDQWERLSKAWAEFNVHVNRVCAA